MSLHELLSGLQCYVMGYNVDRELDDVDRIYPDDANLFKRHFSETVASLKRVHNALEDKESKSDGQASDGLYRRAFNAGVHEVLNNFAPLFVEIEKIILEDPYFSLISVVAKLSPLSVTVAALDEGIANLESNQITGVPILDLCDTYVRLGPPRVQSAYLTIYRTCLKVFFKQTTDWILTAKLFDPKGEYFIERNFADLQEDDCTSVPSTCGSTCSLDTLDQSALASYKIALDKLPSFIPYSVAKKVLFVGESLILVKNNGESPTYASTDEERRRAQQYALDPFEVNRKIRELLEEEEILYVHRFDNFITGIFLETNRKLRDLAFHVGKVDKQIVLIRDLYFLGRGELFQEFILTGEAHLKRPAKKVKSRFLLNSFTDAFYSVYLTDVSEILDAVNFILPARDSLPDNVTALDCLSLVVKINWPLGGIFTQSIVSVYRHSFRFLIKLKKAQMSVCKIWVEMKADKDGRTSGTLVSLMAKLKFFVSNLLSYCFSDVIASEMHALTSSVANADTYTDIQNSVETFTKNVAENLFLSSQEENSLVEDADSDLEADSPETTKRSVHKHLSDIFTCCHDLWSSIEDSQGYKESKIVDIEKRTDSSIRLLVKLCNSQPSNDSLSNLHRRLDFSDFFTRRFLGEKK